MAKRWYFKDKDGNKVASPQYKVNSQNHYTKAETDALVRDVVDILNMLKEKTGIELSDLKTGKVGFCDYPDEERAGVVKDCGYGAHIDKNGCICIDPATASEINLRLSAYKPIVPQNLNYAVKSGLVSNNYSLTQSESVRVQEWIGLYNKGNLENSKTVYQHAAELKRLNFHDFDTGECGVSFYIAETEGFWIDILGKNGCNSLCLSFPTDTHYNTFMIRGTHGKLDFCNDILTGLLTPTEPKDAANKLYVDSAVAKPIEKQEKSNIILSDTKVLHLGTRKEVEVAMPRLMKENAEYEFIFTADSGITVIFPTGIELGSFTPVEGKTYDCIIYNNRLYYYEW